MSGIDPLPLNQLVDGLEIEAWRAQQSTITNKGVVHSSDSHSSRFAGLLWLNPLR